MKPALRDAGRDASKDARCFAIESAQLADIPTLVAIEETCFTTDRLNRRSFRHFLTRANADTFVARDNGGTVIAYAIVMYQRGSALSRLYSMAVSPDVRHQGVGSALLDRIEAAVREHDCAYLRLEVRADNLQARRLYAAHGYKAFGTYAHYYDDNEDAVRMQKRLSATAEPEILRAEYYLQHLKFTCGPASLMVAMQLLDSDYQLSQHEELRIWREATTIFMTSGHGGCGPHGLALAACARGFHAEIFVNRKGPLFLEGVRSESKKAAMTLAHEDFMREIEDREVPMHYRTLALHEIQQALAAGQVPITLISSYRFDGKKTPHWVVITGISDDFVYIHDPYVDWKEQMTPTDCMHVPVVRDSFRTMTRYGSKSLSATVLLSKRNP